MLVFWDLPVVPCFKKLVHQFVNQEIPKSQNLKIPQTSLILAAPYQIACNHFSKPIYQKTKIAKFFYT